MLRVGTVLGLGAVASVLALGGVETPAFAPAQVGVLILATVTFWRRGFSSVSRPILCVLRGLFRAGFAMCG